MEINNPHQIPELTKLLYKIVIQFGFYTQKSDQELDEYLTILTAALKQGVELNLLTPDLKRLSKTLARLIQNKNNSLITTLLIDYLLHKSDLTENDSLKIITQQLTDHQFKSKDILYSSIDQALSIDRGSDHDNQKNMFHSRLIHLLDAINVPAKFHAQWLVLRQLCDNENISLTALNDIIDKAVALFSNIKANALLEQHNFDNFLFSIMQSIANIEETAQQVTVENQISMDNRHNFSAAMNSQVEMIKSTTNEASELAMLQQNINQSLDKLRSQIHEHQEEEDIRQVQLQLQLNEITEKLQSTESESVLLRSKLQLTHKLAFLDHLTGVANRLAYDQRIEQEMQRLLRYKNPLSIIVWDIDHFKQINDAYGHKSGDKALTLIAQIIQKNCRECDFVARYGGEEFVSILPNTTGESAMVVAEKIRKIIEQSPFKARGDTINIHISAGVHQCREEDSVDSAFDYADRALYHAKKNGRNQCINSLQIIEE